MNLGRWPLPRSVREGNDALRTARHAPAFEGWRTCMDPEPLRFPIAGEDAEPRRIVGGRLRAVVATPPKVTGDMDTCLVNPWSRGVLTATVDHVLRSRALR